MKICTQSGSLKLLTVAVITALLTACGGGSGSANGSNDVVSKIADTVDDKNNDQDGDDGQVISYVTLNDLAGVWKEKRTVFGDEDIRYIVYKTDGTKTIYDYQNDALGNGKQGAGYNNTECSDIYASAIKELGNGKFQVGEEEKTFLLDGDNLTIKTVQKNTVDVVTLEKSDKTEDDINIDCEEIDQTAKKEEEPKPEGTPPVPEKPEIADDTAETAVTLADIQDKVWFKVRKLSFFPDKPTDVRYFVFNDKGERVIYDYKNDEYAANKFGDGEAKDCYQVITDEADYGFKAGAFFTKGASLISRDDDGSLATQIYASDKTKDQLVPVCQ